MASSYDMMSKLGVDELLLQPTGCTPCNRDVAPTGTAIPTIITGKLEYEPGQPILDTWHNRDVGRKDLLWIIYRGSDVDPNDMPRNVEIRIRCGTNTDVCGTVENDISFDFRFENGWLPRQESFFYVVVFLDTKPSRRSR